MLISKNNPIMAYLFEYYNGIVFEKSSVGNNVDIILI